MLKFSGKASNNNIIWNLLLEILPCTRQSLCIMSSIFRYAYIPEISVYRPFFFLCKRNFIFASFEPFDILYLSKLVRLNLKEEPKISKP